MISANIISLRKKAGLSQEALARAVGIRQPTVAAYEAGKANPGPEIRALIRERFQVTVAKNAKGKTAQRAKKAQSLAEAKRKIREGGATSIRELRKTLGMTQAAFAESIGVSTGTVTAYESGKIHPSRRVAARIREKYGTDIPHTGAAK